MKNKKILPPNLEWYAMVEFKEADVSVTLNPFCRYPVPEPQSIQMSSRISETLFFDIAHINLTLIEHVVGNRLLFPDFKNATSDEVKVTLNNLQTVAEVPI